MPIVFKKASKDQGAPQGTVCQKNPHLDNVKFTLFSIYIKFMKQRLGSAGSIRMSTCDLSLWRWHCHRAVAIGAKIELCSEKKSRSSVAFYDPELEVMSYNFHCQSRHKPFNFKVELVGGRVGNKDTTS